MENLLYIPSKKMTLVATAPNKHALGWIINGNLFVQTRNTCPEENFMFMEQGNDLYFKWDEYEL